MISGLSPRKGSNGDPRIHHPNPPRETVEDMPDELIFAEVHRVVELKVMAGCWGAAEWEARRQGVPERVRPTIRRLGQPGIAPEVWRWEWYEPTVVKADPAART